ncbi:uncharacterized protein WM277_012381 [Molossus nigricans]
MGPHPLVTVARRGSPLHQTLRLWDNGSLEEAQMSQPGKSMSASRKSRGYRRFPCMRVPCEAWGLRSHWQSSWAQNQEHSHPCISNVYVEAPHIKGHASGPVAFADRPFLMVPFQEGQQPGAEQPVSSLDLMEP